MPKDLLIDLPPSRQTGASERVTWDRDVPQLGLRERGSTRTWIVQWRVDGRSRKRTLGPVARINRDMARRLARDLLDGAARADRTDATQTIAAFGARYLEDKASSWKPSTKRGHASDMARMILPHLGSKPVASLTRDEVEAWLAALPLSAASRNRAIAVLSGMMRNAELLGLRAPGSNPCKGLRRRRSGFTATYLTDAQWAKLGKALRKAETAHSEAVGCLRFIALTGCRKGEALGLTWERVDGARCLLSDSKSGPRTLWLGAPARRLLASFARSNAYVFGQGQFPLKLHKIDEVWRSVREDVGLKALRMHDLRHSFASAAINERIDLTLVGGLLGHADLKTSAGYAHLEQSSVQAASQRVGAHLENAARTKRKKPQVTNDLFASFCSSRLSLPEFCAEHQLDPRAFRKGLIAWRESAKGGKA